MRSLEDGQQYPRLTAVHSQSTFVDHDFKPSSTDADSAQHIDTSLRNFYECSRYRFHSSSRHSSAKSGNAKQAYILRSAPVASACAVCYLRARQPSGDVCACVRESIRSPVARHIKLQNNCWARNCEFKSTKHHLSSLASASCCFLEVCASTLILCSEVYFDHSGRPATSSLAVPLVHKALARHVACTAC